MLDLYLLAVCGIFVLPSASVSQSVLWGDACCRGQEVCPSAPQTNGASKPVFCTARGVENRHHFWGHGSLPPASHCCLPEMAESREGGQSDLRASVACCPVRSQAQRVEVLQGQGQRFTRGDTSRVAPPPRRRLSAAQGPPAELRPAQVPTFPGLRAAAHSEPSPAASSALAPAHSPLQAASPRLPSERRAQRLRALGLLRPVFPFAFFLALREESVLQSPSAVSG